MERPLGGRVSLALPKCCSAMGTSAAAAGRRRAPKPGAVAQNHQSGRIVVSLKEILLTVRRRLALRHACGARTRTRAMIETVTVFFALTSVGIFIAHAYDGYRSR